VRGGKPAQGHARLSEALDLAHDLKVPDGIVLANAHRALMPGGDVREALSAAEEYGSRLSNPARMETRFRLWLATKDKAHLAEAHRLLCFARDHAPEDCRDSMIENVPLHRDIMKAWEEQGAGDG
jgi:hypothetical protein